MMGVPLGECVSVPEFDKASVNGVVSEIKFFLDALGESCSMRPLCASNRVYGGGDTTSGLLTTTNYALKGSSGAYRDAISIRSDESSGCVLLDAYLSGDHSADWVVILKGKRTMTVRYEGVGLHGGAFVAQATLFQVREFFGRQRIQFEFGVNGVDTAERVMEAIHAVLVSI